MTQPVRSPPPTPPSTDVLLMPLRMAWCSRRGECVPLGTPPSEGMDLGAVELWPMVDADVRDEIVAEAKNMTDLGQSLRTDTKQQRRAPFANVFARVVRRRERRCRGLDATPRPGILLAQPIRDRSPCCFANITQLRLAGNFLGPEAAAAVVAQLLRLSCPRGAAQPAAGERRASEDGGVTIFAPDQWMAETSDDDDDSAHRSRRRPLLQHLTLLDLSYNDLGSQCAAIVKPLIDAVEHSRLQRIQATLLTMLPAGAAAGASAGGGAVEAARNQKVGPASIRMRHAATKTAASVGATAVRPVGSRRGSVADALDENGAPVDRTTTPSGGLPAPCLPQLRTLLLGWNDLGDAGIAMLAPTLATQFFLTSVDATGNDVTPEAAKSLSESLRGHGTLKRVDVS